MSATWSGCARSWRSPARSSWASNDGSAHPPTGAASATRWTMARPGRSEPPSRSSTVRATRIGPKRSSTGARAAGPASATSRSCRRPSPARCGPSVTTCWTRRRDSPSPTPRSRSPRRDRRRSSATPRSRSIPTIRATGPSSVERLGSPSWSATSRSSRTTWSTRRSGPAPSRSRPPTITMTARRGCGTGSPAPTILADDATVTGTGTAYDGLDRYEARRRIVADLEAMGDLVGSTAARDGHRPVPAQRRCRGAAPQDAVVHPHQAARRARAWPRRGRAGRGSCRRCSRRPGNTG